MQVIAIEAPNLESINEILYKVIEKDPNIIHTETSLVLTDETINSCKAKFAG